MLFELMSNGNLEKLPDQQNNQKVMVLLPRNKYLVGKETQSRAAQWFYGTLGEPLELAKSVDLSDKSGVSLPVHAVNDEKIFLSSKIVDELNRSLFSQIEPPGNHRKTLAILQTFIKNIDFKNEIIIQIYWALRFALSRYDLESVTRLKTWYRINSNERIELSEQNSKIWFSILEEPEEHITSEIFDLGFSKDDINKMLAQKFDNVSQIAQRTPIKLYNSEAGWLILTRFGYERTVYFIWIYLDSSTYRKFKNEKTSDIVMNVWAEYDIKIAIKERDKYKKEELFL